MRSIHKKLFVITALSVVGMAGCYDQAIHPVTEEAFPLKVVLDVTEGGTYESEDEYGLEVTFDGGVDPVEDENGEIIAGSPEGTRGPFSKDITVMFKLKDAEGIVIGSEVSLSEVKYVDPADECNELEAAFTFNGDGSGSFTIPQQVEKVELVFSLDDGAVDDNLVNDDDRSFVLEMTGLSGATGNEVILDINNEFEYKVLDDEDIFTEWVLDHTNPDALSAFITLFSPVNEDLESLIADDINEIKMGFEYDEVKIVVELVETEMEEECGEIEEKNLEIEIEGEFEVEDGAIEIDFENADEDEFAYEGSYTVTQGDPNLLGITLSGEDEDGEEVAPSTSLTLDQD